VFTRTCNKNFYPDSKLHKSTAWKISAGFIQNLFLYLVFEFLGFELQTTIFEVSHNFMELNHKY